jgi:hypothetical protein
MNASSQQHIVIGRLYLEDLLRLFAIPRETNPNVVQNKVTIAQSLKAQPTIHKKNLQVLLAGLFIYCSPNKRLRNYFINSKLRFTKAVNSSPFSNPCDIFAKSNACFIKLS